MSYAIRATLSWQQPIEGATVPQDPEVAELLKSLECLDTKARAQIIERANLHVVTLDAWVAEQIKSDDYAGSALNRDGTSREKVTWYDSDRWVTDLSERMPGVLFSLRRDGEQAGDRVMVYARDGKMHYAKSTIAFEPFSPAKLEEYREGL